MTDERAAAIRERLAWIARERGAPLDGLTPDLVVEDARNPDSPLHDCFDWDVQRAAKEHWLDIARKLIVSVRIEVRTETLEIQSVAYVRDPLADERSQGYVSVAKVRTDRERREALYREELIRIAGHLRRLLALVAEIGKPGRYAPILAVCGKLVGLIENAATEKPKAKAA